MLRRWSQLPKIAKIITYHRYLNTRIPSPGVCSAWLSQGAWKNKCKIKSWGSDHVHHVHCQKPDWWRSRPSLASPTSAKNLAKRSILTHLSTLNNCALFYEVPRPSAMNSRSGTFSPASTADGSEWSEISRYNTAEISPLQTNNNRANLAIPPVSGSSNRRHGSMINGGSRRPGDAWKLSPPNWTGRSSYGNNNVYISE